MSEMISYTCLLCGLEQTALRAFFHREGGNCTGCGCNVRMRSVVHALIESFGLDMKPLRQQGRQETIRGIGLSDHDSYAIPLRTCFDYTNTFFHTEPFFDICHIRDSDREAYDFMISSDVFEHVMPPRQQAFLNAAHVLKPGGTLVLTVPYTDQPKTAEYYPGLTEYAVLPIGDDWRMFARYNTGEMRIHKGLFWHGGPGSTLEMRVFARADIFSLLEKCNFTDIRVHEELQPQWGVVHSHTNSFVISARRGETIPAELPEEADDAVYSSQADAPQDPLYHFPVEEREKTFFDVLGEASVTYTALKKDNQQLRERLMLMEDSRSWQVTAPLRWMLGARA